METCRCAGTGCHKLLPSSFSFVPVEAREMPTVPMKPNNYALYAVVRVCVCVSAVRAKSYSKISCWSKARFQVDILVT